MATLREHWDAHDFFFLHYKPTDAAGEGRRLRREGGGAGGALDAFIPDVLALEPDVFMVAGDHSTPALLASHSWHPVPFLLHSKWTRGEGIEAFSERACGTGSLGRFPAEHIMLQALAHGEKLVKFGP